MSSACSSHYSHVVWYTGDDYVTRAPDAPGGSGIDRLAVDIQNRVRDFLNEGGKLFYTGQNAGREFAEGYTYNPFQRQEGQYCRHEHAVHRRPGRLPAVLARGQQLHR